MYKALSPISFAADPTVTHVLGSEAHNEPIDD